jgi:hypothetical protein
MLHHTENITSINPVDDLKINREKLYGITKRNKIGAMPT